jgi:putative DNA primase/helicase
MADDVGLDAEAQRLKDLMSGWSASAGAAGAGQVAAGLDADPETPHDNGIVYPDPPEDEGGPSDEGASGVNLDTVATCAALDHSDTDNAKRLMAHFGHDLAVMLEEGSDKAAWLVWTGTHWDQSDGNKQALRIAQGVGGRIGLEAEFLEPTPLEAKAIRLGARFLDTPADKLEEGQIDIREAAKVAIKAHETRRVKRRAFGVSSKNLARMNAMLTCAAPFLVQPPNAWNADPRLVYLSNGVLRFSKVYDVERSGEATAWKGTHSFTEAGWSRDDRVTKILGVAYDALATCDLWDAFLARFLPDDEVRRAVQIFCGLGLTGLPVQRLFFHYGLGANGKSVFLEVLSRVIGMLAVGLPAESISGSTERGAGSASPDLARLHGARFVRITEMPQGEPLREALVKRLTGGEDIDVRTLFKGYFSFKPQFKAHMSGNGYPKIEGSDNGIWRRMAVVPWTVTLAEHDQRDFEDVVSEMVAQAPGILNWLIRGVEMYDGEGLKLPAAMVDAAQEFRDEVDPIDLFIRSCVRPVNPEAGLYVRARTAYDAYVSWSLANGKGKGRHETTFGKVMVSRFPRKKMPDGNVYIDIELVDVPERPRNPHEDYTNDR